MDPLTALFEERYHPMVRLAAWLVGDSGVAEDIVQDAFVRLNRAEVDVGALDSASAYLRTAVVNLCRTRMKREAMVRRHRVREAALQPLSVAGPESFLIDEQLVAAVAALPRRQRECVVLRYSEDLTVEQIAGTLGTGAGSVKTHLHRALKALAKNLGTADGQGRQPELRGMA